MTLPGGVPYETAPLAAEIAERFFAEHPDDLARYEDPGTARAWCEHDNRYLLSWAAMDACGAASVVEQVSWLARVLEARGYPLAHLVDDLLIAADRVEARVGPPGADVAAALRRAGEHVGGTPTFLA
jgi:hypothetical protein